MIGARIWQRLVVLGVLAGAPVVASAQPQRPQTVEDETRPATKKQQRREKIKQRIRALRAYTLTEQLELDEAMAGKLFPALAKYDDELDKLLAARADIQRRLRTADGDAKAIDAVIDEAVANQRAIWDTETRRLAQLRKILTPPQVARVLIVLPAMERRIQNQLRRAIRKQGRGAGAVAPVPGDTVDPFGDGNFNNRKQPRPTPAPKATKPCDPFGSMRPCR